MMWVTDEMTRDLSEHEVPANVWAEFTALSGSESVFNFVQKYDYTISETKERMAIKRPNLPKKTYGQILWGCMKVEDDLKSLPESPSAEDMAIIMALPVAKSEADIARDINYLDAICRKYITPARKPRSRPKSSGGADAKNEFHMLKGMTQDERRAHFEGKRATE